MAVDYLKLANMIQDNYEKDLINRYYEEFEKNFDSYMGPKFKEAIRTAIDEFYNFPEGKIYTRSGQFNSGKGLIDIHVSNGGRVVAGSAGEGFPAYPVVHTKKWSRTRPWPGDEAWGVLFEDGMHGTGKMNIGKTNPTPYDIVEKEGQNAINEYVQMLSNDIIPQLQKELFNTYLNACM